MDLIKVNGDVLCAIKAVLKAKNAGLGEKIPLLFCIYCLGIKITHAIMFLKFTRNCRISSFCEN